MNVTIIVDNYSAEISFNSLDALHQIWNITIKISHTKFMFLILYVGPSYNIKHAARIGTQQSTW